MDEHDDNEYAPRKITVINSGFLSRMIGGTMLRKSRLWLDRIGASTHGFCVGVSSAVRVADILILLT